MSNIADYIECYLKKLLSENPCGYVEIRRNELAGRFNCVPSQINYVLTTRFSASQGYLVESRRGGGGYVRVVKLPLEKQGNLALDIYRLIGDTVSRSEAEGLIGRLYEGELITWREAQLMQAVVSRSIAHLDAPLRDRFRALSLKAMVVSILRTTGETRF
ncbi:MAG: CtsR family transcriptional regulator [Peptococcaceae bacterium]|jgi:transcriptional regulator CtsR|nr:MAG: CtsR family transcriptional regulator [Peptococcaceae bacterium]